MNNLKPLFFLESQLRVDRFLILNRGKYIASRFFLLMVFAVVSLGAHATQWRVIQPMSHARSSHTMTQLPDGKILVAGGNEQKATELFDPENETWAATGDMVMPRSGHTATLLPNGLVLVVGGRTVNEAGVTSTTATAEIYNPSTGTWRTTGAMNVPRYRHTATLLRDGRVLVVGGCCERVYGRKRALNSAEIYDPSTETWVLVSSMSERRRSHTAHILADGSVLIAGGSGHTFKGGTKSAEIYYPITDTWQTISAMAFVHADHGTVTLLDGSVLVVGGSPSGCCAGTREAEVFNPANRAWSSVGSLANRRKIFTTTRLADGKVLAAGGYSCCLSSPNYISSTEIYDPDTQQWTNSGDMNFARMGHAAILLKDGRVLVAGGETYLPEGGEQTINEAEIFEYGSVVVPSNRPPVAKSANYQTNENTPLDILLEATDPDDNPLTFAVVSSPINGLLSGVPPNLTYTPSSGFSGMDSFTFKANDGSLDSEVAVIKITVQAVTSDGISNPGASITIDGNFSDWSGLQSFGPDPDDVTGASNKLDWLEGWMAHNGNDLFIAYRTQGPIVTNGGFWAYQIYLDTDADEATGYGSLGAEYLVEGNSLWRYTGDGGSWRWQYLGAMAKAVNNNQLEMRVPLQQLGSPTQLRLRFIGRNAAFGGDITDRYPDSGGDVVAFSYSIGDGSTPPPGVGNGDVSNPVASIAIDGNLSDWNGTQSFGLDPDDVAGTNNQLDWLEGWMSHNSTNLFIAYRTQDPIITGDAFWGYQIFLDTDENEASGYSMGALGVEYLLEGNNLWRYTGDGNSWSWQYVGDMVMAASNNQLEVRLPLQQLGNPTGLRVKFVGNNEAFGGNVIDNYPDNGSGYFSYSLN
ncbi:MAG TPA: hypothetical protein ENJ86_09295 [Methylothermaceae bacterium]|nr:hypothetical protein [Methylothermaceae bacterium]